MLKKFDGDQIHSLAFTGSLFKGTAHNINTPLSSILGRADIARLRLDRLAATLSDDALLQELEKFKRDIGLIIENSNKLNRLVKSAMNRCVTAVQNRPVPVNIASLLRDDLDFLMSDMEFKHNIEKRFDLDVSIPPIMGAPVHFSNSFNEIIDNACAAMRDNEKKIIEISVHGDGERIVVEIVDNGRGMDEATRSDVMRLLAAPPAHDANGAGGLAYVSRLLAPYRACFTVESVPGRTAVRVELPV